MDDCDALPSTPIVSPPRALLVSSLGLLVAGLGYLALVVAGRQTAVRERLVDEQREARRSVDLLLSSLAALKVGLDLVGLDGRSQLQNETARALKEHPQAAEAAKAVEAIVGDHAISQRFAVPSPEKGAGGERIIDLVALPPSPGRSARARLYVDRTDELLVEKRQLMLERLATLGRAMQGVAHELNTPLTTMQTLAKDLRAALADAPLDDRLRKDVEESLALLVEESQRCRALTQALLSRADDGRRQTAPQTLLEVVRRAVRLVAPAEEGDAVLLDEGTLQLACPADSDRVLQIVMNLVQNALRATVELRGDGRGPRVVVRAATTSAGVRVQISDRGPGLPGEVRTRLFEPFVTTRPVGEGTGLGLYTSQRIAREIGATLSLDDGPDGGTVARLMLPA
jgi:signal transduction histidine kinase